MLAKPSHDGLIVGRVGDEWPSLYVNAVSYRGLLAAAEFAERLGSTGTRQAGETMPTRYATIGNAETAMAPLMPRSRR